VKKTKRVRDELSELPGPGYWKEKIGEGWRLVAVEWERDAEEAPETSDVWEEVPYGLKVADDCMHLVENQPEKEAMSAMLELIVADKSMSEVAQGVNQRGFRTRQGTKWTPIAVFNLLPRLVEASSRIYPTTDWAERRRKIFRVG